MTWDREHEEHLDTLAGLRPSDTGEGPAAERRGPATGPAPVPHPSPEEAELAGLGWIVAIMRRMSTAERWELVDYLAERYGTRAPITVPLNADYTPAMTNDLTGEILRSYRRSIELSAHALATILLDAGWRKTL